MDRKEDRKNDGPETAVFDSVEAFEAARERLIRSDRDLIEKDEGNDTEAPAGAERK